MTSELYIGQRFPRHGPSSKPGAWLPQLHPQRLREAVPEPDPAALCIEAAAGSQPSLAASAVVMKEISKWINLEGSGGKPALLQQNKWG